VRLPASQPRKISLDFVLFRFIFKGVFAPNFPNLFGTKEIKKPPSTSSGGEFFNI